MNLVNHGLPSPEGLPAIKMGNVRIIGGRRAIDHGALRYDQPNFPFSAARIIVRHIRRWHPPGRKRARHRSHDNPVLEFKGLQLEWPEELMGSHNLSCAKIYDQRLSQTPFWFDEF